MPRRLDKKEATVEEPTPDVDDLNLEGGEVDPPPAPELVPVDRADEPPAVEVVNIVPPQRVPLDVNGPNVAFQNRKKPEQAKDEEGKQDRGEEPPRNIAQDADYKITTFQAVRFRYKGKYPALAINNNNQAVAVYHHNNFLNDMFYCVGKLNPADDTIRWGEEHRYDQGAYPQIAVNNSGVVVQVHESPRKRKTWYHVGMIYDDTIDWGPSYEIGQGLHPAVALSDDDQVVIVEESGGRLFAPESFYFFGKVNKADKTILFSRKRELLVHSGKELSVTMKRNNIIVAFRHARNHGKLHTMLGKIDGLNVQWAEYEFTHFAEGNWPSVSLNGEGVVVVSCQTYASRRVFCREGELKERDGLCYVQWSKREARQYDHGVYPSICLLEGNRLVELHGTNKLNGHSIWYTLGYVKK